MFIWRLISGRLFFVMHAESMLGCAEICVYLQVTLDTWKDEVFERYIYLEAIYDSWALHLLLREGGQGGWWRCEIEFEHV